MRYQAWLWLGTVRLAWLPYLFVNLVKGLAILCGPIQSTVLPPNLLLPVFAQDEAMQSVLAKGAHLWSLSLYQ